MVVVVGDGAVDKCKISLFGFEAVSEEFIRIVSIRGEVGLWSMGNGVGYGRMDVSISFS